MSKFLAGHLTKLVLVPLVAVLFMGGCKKSEEETATTDENSETPTLSLSGTYKSSCTAVSGSPLASGNYIQTSVRFGISDATEYEYVKYFYSDSGCTTKVYGSLVSGHFEVGDAVSGLTDTFAIGYTVENSYILIWDNTTSGAVATGCASNVSWGSVSSNTRLGTVYSDFSCASMSVKAPTVGLYNLVKMDGTNVKLGIPDGDNPGVVNASSLDTSLSLTFTP